MFRHRHQLRHWAARALLVWLFGVVTGVANACWTESLAHPDADAAMVSSVIAQPECESHGGLHHAASDETAPGSGEQHAKSVCQTYCDGFSASITQLKSPVDKTAAPAILASTFVVGAQFARTSSAHQLMPRRDGGQPPAITIALLRLTL
jgi:hypothetical protein